jgi:hypothetical protein
MTRTSRTRRALVSAAFTAAALVALTGCSSDPIVADTVAEQLPDLTADGYESFECGTGVAIDDQFIIPEAPYVAECWKGAPNDPFIGTANTIQTKVMQATGGIDVSDQACPADVLNADAGIACRAVYVGEEGNDVLIRVIVTVADLTAVLEKVPSDNPTSDDVIAALADADIEVLIGSEPVPAA